VKPRFSNQTNRALTLTEVLVVVMLLIVLAAIVIPGGPVAKDRAMRLSCTSNLKQISLAFELSMGDQGDKYPMGISVTNGGSMEMVETGNVVQTFLLMTNGLNTPKILFCPADTSRFWTNDFAGLSNSNISYFVALDANDNYQERLLSGDCNFEIGGVPVKSGLLEIPINTPVAWTAARHKFAGNIGLCDGSVQMVDNSSLTKLFNQTDLATNRLAIP